MTKLTAVYLAAGLSSRFGGRIKALIRVAPNNQTLMGYSMSQAKKAGFNHFVIIASKKTIDQLKEEYKDSFLGIPVEYALQETPEWREKPFGTSHAAHSAKNIIQGSFIVLNSDDIYGENTLRLMADYLKKNKEGYCIPGYKLKNVVPENGGVNRGLISVDSENNVTKIVENFNITKKDIPSRYSGEELISMNLFGLQPSFIDFLEKNFPKFLEKIGKDPKKEWLLPDSISDFAEKHKIKIEVIPTDDVWVGVTNPEDEEIARKKLKNQ
jgi:NDP-sugar pyrophosphorylase family protein